MNVSMLDPYLTKVSNATQAMLSEMPAGTSALSSFSLDPFSWSDFSQSL